MEEFNGHVFCRFNLKTVSPWPSNLSTAAQYTGKYCEYSVLIVLILDINHRGDVPRKPVFFWGGGGGLADKVG